MNIVMSPEDKQGFDLATGGSVTVTDVKKPIEVSAVKS